MLLALYGATIGKSAELGIQAATNQAICFLIPNETLLDRAYLRQFLAASKTSFIRRGAGGAQPNITQGIVRETEIPLPPLAEQKRIAAILDQAGRLRRRRREALALLDTLAGSIFVEMFGTQASAEAFDSVSLFSLCRPKQWPIIKATQFTESGYPVYGANGRVGFYPEYNHEEPTILITCRGATCGTINVCEPESYVTGNAMALDNLDTDVVTLSYMEQALRVRGVDDAITGSAQPQITRQSLGGVKVLVPPVDLQREFEMRVERLRSAQPKLQSHAHELDTLFASLQSRAFAGEL